jgi:hypothetical protein
MERDAKTYHSNDLQGQTMTGASPDGWQENANRPANGQPARYMQPTRVIPHRTVTVIKTRKERNEKRRSHWPWVWLVFAVVAAFLLFLLFNGLTHEVAGVSRSIDEQTSVLKDQNQLLLSLKESVNAIVLAIKDATNSIIQAISQLG